MSEIERFDVLIFGSGAGGFDRIKPICSTSFWSGSRTSISSASVTSFWKISGQSAAMRESEALMKEADFASRFRNKLDARNVWLLRP